MTASFIKPTLFAVLSLVVAWSCSPAQNPDVLPTPLLLLKRVFDYTNPARQVTASYRSDQLTATVTQDATALTLSLGPVSASAQPTDGFLLTLPTAAIKPSLTGTYTADTNNGPFSLQYIFTPEASSQPNAPTNMIGMTNNLEPGSSLTVSAYDQQRGLVSGQFTLLFFIGDPYQPAPRVPVGTAPTSLVRVTLTGTFTNLRLNPKG